jgi:hypothetical protein
VRLASTRRKYTHASRQVKTLLKRAWKEWEKNHEKDTVSHGDSEVRLSSTRRKYTHATRQVKTLLKRAWKEWEKNHDFSRVNTVCGCVVPVQRW